MLGQKRNDSLFGPGSRTIEAPQSVLEKQEAALEGSPLDEAVQPPFETQAPATAFTDADDLPRRTIATEAAAGQRSTPCSSHRRVRVRISVLYCRMFRNISPANIPPSSQMVWERIPRANQAIHQQICPGPANCCQGFVRGTAGGRSLHRDGRVWLPHQVHLRLRY